MENIDSLDIMAFLSLLILAWAVILIYLDEEKK